MRRQRKRRLRSKAKSCRVKCLCEEEQDVIFPKPSLLKPITIEKECEHCGTLWNFKISNDLTCEKDTYRIKPSAISISQKAVAVMRRLADARNENLFVNNEQQKGENNG